MKLTHSKTASRRAHHKKHAPHLVSTPSGARRRHFVDPATGMYRGKQIIAIGTDSATDTKRTSSSRTSTAKKAKGKEK